LFPHQEETGGNWRLQSDGSFSSMKKTFAFRLATAFGFWSFSDNAQTYIQMSRGHGNILPVISRCDQKVGSAGRWSNSPVSTIDSDGIW